MVVTKVDKMASYSTYTGKPKIFFPKKVRSEESLLSPDKSTKNIRWVPEFGLDGSSSLKHNGSTKDLASVMENLKKSSLVSRQNQSLNTQVTSSTTQQTPTTTPIIA